MGKVGILSISKYLISEVWVWKIWWQGKKFVLKIVRFELGNLLNDPFINTNREPKKKDCWTIGGPLTTRDCLNVQTVIRAESVERGEIFRHHTLLCVWIKCVQDSLQHVEQPWFSEWQLRRTISRISRLLQASYNGQSFLPWDLDGHNFLWSHPLPLHTLSPSHQLVPKCYWQSWQVFLNNPTLLYLEIRSSIRCIVLFNNSLLGELAENRLRIQIL